MSIKNGDSMQCEPEVNRFVILDHHFPPRHWRARHYDLMLEFEGILETFECPLGFLNAVIPASGQYGVFRLANHRKEYLDYEGEISGNRGCVKRITSGEVIWQQREEQSFQVRLIGPDWERWLCGKMVVDPVPPGGDRWTLDVNVVVRSSDL
jgi:hypothetical protein